MADGAASKISQDKSSIKTKERSPDAPFRQPQIGSYDSMLSLSGLIGNQAAGQLFQFQESDSINPNPPLPGIVQKILNSNTGKPLDPATRSYMESRFNHDFSQVRIHTDAGAAESARAINAVAYTVNQDVVFGGNTVALGTEAGQHVLAHELAHVVQQGRSNDSNILSSTANHSLEESADRAATAFTEGGGTVQVDGASAPGLACLTLQEAEHKLGRFVPSFIKQRTKPLVESLHTVVDPKTELPKSAEKIVDQTEAAAAVILPPTPAAAPSPPPGDASSPASANPQKPPTVENSKSKEASVGMLTKATEGVKGLVRDKALEGIGTVKGVVTQVTEVADTVLWLGGEYKELRDKAAEAIGGEPGSIGNQFVSGSIDAATFIIPGAQSLKSLADANEQAKAAGLIDKQTGQASLTTPLSDQLNETGKWVESKVGGTPSDSFLLTPMERAELEAAIGTQVALAFTGAEEVKVAMNVLGALGGLRGVVERIRANPDGWHKDAAFWSSLIGMALSVVGLKHTMAASKITTIILKFGWIAAAIPPLTQMVIDYTDTQLSEQERDKRMKQHWSQVIHVLKDAILHVVQSQGGKTRNSEIEAPPSSSKARTPATGGTENLQSSSTAKSVNPPIVESRTPATSTTPTQSPPAPITARPAQRSAPDVLPKPPVMAEGAKVIPLKPTRTSTSQPKPPTSSRSTGKDIEGAKILPFKGAGDNVSQPKPPTSPKSTGESAEVIPIESARKPPKAQEQVQPFVEAEPLAATGTGDATPSVVRTGNRSSNQVSAGVQNEPIVAMAGNSSGGGNTGKPVTTIASIPTKGTTTTSKGSGVKTSQAKTPGNKPPTRQETPEEYLARGGKVTKLPYKEPLPESAIANEAEAILGPLAKPDPLAKLLSAVKGTYTHTEFNKQVVPKIQQQMPADSVFMPSDAANLGKVLGKGVPWQQGGPDLVLVDASKKTIAVLDLTKQPSQSHAAKTADYAKQLRQRYPDWNIPDEYVRDFHYGNQKVSVQTVLGEIGPILKVFGLTP